MCIYEHLEQTVLSGGPSWHRPGAADFQSRTRCSGEDFQSRIFRAERDFQSRTRFSGEDFQSRIFRAERDFQSRICSRVILAIFYPFLK